MNQTKKKFISSKLRHLSRPDFQDEWRSISKSLDLIFDDKPEKISIIRLSRIIYKLCSYGLTGNIIEQMQRKFSRYFKKFLNESLQTYDMDSPNAEFLARDFILKTGVIMPRFQQVSSAISTVFTSLSIYKGNFSISDVLHESFREIISNTNYYQYILFSICKLFDSFLDEFQIETFREDPLFISVKSTKTFVSYASPENLNRVRDTLTHQCMNFFQQFVSNFYKQIVPPQPLESIIEEDDEEPDTSIFAGRGHFIAEEKPPFDPIPHILEYCDEGSRLIELEYQIIEEIFDLSLASIIKQKAYKELSNPKSETFLVCLEYINILLKERRFDDYKKFFDLASHDSTAINNLFHKMIEQLSNESTKIPELAETIAFYQKVGELFKTVKKEYMDNTNKSLTKLINGDWKTVLKGLLVTINEDALTDSDISKILPIISFFQMKTDLELMHIKQAAKRLTKNRSDQIDKEYSIMEQLDSVRPQLQLESLRALINDAAKSLEQNHFGPVLILNSRSWPYKPPYPSPVNLREITAKISTQYVKIHQTHELHFPINYWIVSVKDTTTSIVYNGTGVQAEIFLYLNTHKIITDTSMEPHINQSFLGAALKSMTHKTAPVLKVQEGVYSLNERYKAREKVIKLQPPSVKDELQTAKDVEKSKGDMIDAAVVKKMKERRVMHFKDLDIYIKEELASKVPVSTDEIRKRVDQLIIRNYLEEMSSGRLGYIP